MQLLLKNFLCDIAYSVLTDFWWLQDFPKYPGIGLQKLVPGLDKVGYDLLDVRLGIPAI